MKNKWLYISIIIRTIFDICFTAWGLKVGFIEEVNPLFAMIFSHSYYIAIAGVIILTGGGLYCIYKFRYKSRIAKYGLYLILFVKIYVMYLHLNWFIPIVPLLIRRYIGL